MKLLLQEKDNSQSETIPCAFRMVGGEQSARRVRRAGALRVSEHVAGAGCALSRARRSVQCPPLQHGTIEKLSR